MMPGAAVAAVIPPDPADGRNRVARGGTPPDAAPVAGVEARPTAGR